MNKLLIFALLSTVALAADIDWSKVYPKDIKVDILGRQYLGAPNQGRIVGGLEAPPYSFPHQVGLISETPEGNGFCGGSIISSEWILTAAHCTEGTQKIHIYLGAHRIRDEDDRTEMIVEPENVIIHEQWDRAALKNDISLIRLPKPVQFNEKIQPIKLPRIADYKTTFENEPAVASGWGKDSDEATAISPVLRYIETSIFSFATCRIMYIFRPNDGNICTNGANGISTCNGDSGGPLIAFEADGTPILIGATSYGSGMGCESGFPAVFTRITHFLEWIHKKTGIELR